LTENSELSFTSLLRWLSCHCTLHWHCCICRCLLLLLRHRLNVAFVVLQCFVNFLQPELSLPCTAAFLARCHHCWLIVYYVLRHSCSCCHLAAPMQCPETSFAISKLLLSPLPVDCCLLRVFRLSFYQIPSQHCIQSCFPSHCHHCQLIADSYLSVASRSWSRCHLPALFCCIAALNDFFTTHCTGHRQKHCCFYNGRLLLYIASLSKTYC